MVALYVSHLTVDSSARLFAHAASDDDVARTATEVKSVDGSTSHRFLRPAGCFRVLVCLVGRGVGWFEWFRRAW